MIRLTLGEHLKDYIEFLGINQNDLADRLGVTKKHVNELLNDKKKFTNEMLIAISLVLDIDVNFMLELIKNNQIRDEIDLKFKTEKELKHFLKVNKFSEAVEKNWFKMQYDNPYIKAKNLMEFLRIPKLSEISKINEKIFFKSNKENDLKVLMWLERCDTLSKKQEVIKYDSKNIEKVITLLKKEALTESFDIERITSILNNNGIKFVFEDALSGSSTRGAFRVKGNTPHIYITSFNKKISSYYFALFHELAHCKTDFNKAKSAVLMENDDKTEQIADEKALEWMIPKNVWGKIKNNLNIIESVKEYKIPASFIVSKMAKEKILKYDSREYIKFIK